MNFNDWLVNPGRTCYLKKELLTFEKAQELEIAPGFYYVAYDLDGDMLGISQNQRVLVEQARHQQLILLQVH